MGLRTSVGLCLQRRPLGRKLSGVSARGEPAANRKSCKAHCSWFRAFLSAGAIVGTRIRNRIFGIAMVAAVLVVGPSGAGGDNGTGRVYVPNQIDDPELHSVVLTGLDGSGYLRGDFADVVNTYTDRAYSNSLTFEYDPGGSWEDRIHFGEAMAYFHITEFQNHLVDLGFAPIDTPVAVRAFDKELNSSYDPYTRTIHLSSVLWGLDSDALDGDMIVHEYAHAVQHQLRGMPIEMPLTSLTEQGSAITEGHADFLAASYFSDAEIGEHAAGIGYRRAFFRNIDNGRKWSAEMATLGRYTASLAFSGALWDLRPVVGAQVVEKLVTQMFHDLPDSDPGTPEFNATFLEAMDTILDIDAVYYASSHHEDIRQAFAVHGIGAYDFATPFPMVHEPGHEYDDIEVYTQGGAQLLEVTFDKFVTKLEDSSFTEDEFPFLLVQKTTFDYLEVLDGNGAVIGTYTGRELQGQTIIVPGDTVQFHLVTDLYRESFGYRVVDISVIDQETVYELLIETFGSVTDLRADFNGDRRVDIEDFAILRANWQAEAASAGDYSQNDGASTPEPTMLGMLMLGGLAVLRRRRFSREVK